MSHRTERQRLDHLETLVNALDGVVWEFDWSTGCFTWVSAGAERLLGYPRDSWLLPGFWADHLHPDDAEHAISFCIAATKDGRDHEFEYRMYHADGFIRWLRDVVSVDPVLRMDGPLRGVLIDITAQKEAEAGTRQLRDLYQALVELSPYAICALDPTDEHVLFANQAAAGMLAASDPGALLGVRLGALAPDVGHASAASDRVFALPSGDEAVRPEPRRTSLLAFDGRRIDVEYAVAPIRFRSEPALLLIARDVTRELAAETAVRRQRDFLDHLLAMLDSGVVVFSGEPPVIVQANEPAERLLGWERGDLVGESLRALFCADDDWRRLNQRLRESDTVVTGYATEMPIARHDGTCLDAEVAIRALGTRLGEYLGIFRDVSARKAMEQAEREHQQRLSALTAEIAETEDRERRRIAVELHDRVSQALAVTRIRLANALGADGAVDPGAYQAALAMLEAAIAETREVTTELHPPVLSELGLGPALRWLAEELERTHGLRVEVTVAEPSPHLSEDRASALFRIARELLVNVAKHAGTSEAWLSLDAVGGEAVLTVADTGGGFDPAAATGFGLFSIRERVPHLGGSIDIESEPGAGTRVTVALPEGD